jgi:serine protease Do
MLINKIAKFFYVALFVVALEAVADLPDFSGYAESLSPAVVNISTTRTIKGGQGGPMMFGGDPNAQEFNEIIQRFFGQGMVPHGRGPDINAESLGSGFIISEDGYIITNNHVIHDADKIIVGLNDGVDYPAKVVGTDPTSDLALLKIDAGHKLPFLTFGSSANLKVGEWVFAIGSPFGFDYSVTQGIVSAKGRGLNTDKYIPFIQTDVAINPGSSGGPLFNMKGEVVGVNSQIVSRSGGYLGLSFAIPSDVAKDVVEQLKKNGKVERGWLGVSFQQMDKDLAESFGLSQPKGALVAEVMEDSPAAKAGLKSGDIIMKFNDKPVASASDLPHLVGFTKPGTKVTLEVLRKGKTMTTDVTVGELAQEHEETPVKEGEKVKANFLGIAVRDLTGDEKKQLEITQGVLIDRIGMDSPAARIGLRPGDVIFMLNNVPMNSKADFDKAAAAIKPNMVVSMLMGRRGLGQRYLAIRIPDME